MATTTLLSVGQRINRWTIIQRLSTAKFLVRCDCGNERIKHAYQITRIKSCGCLHREITRARQLTHGLSKTLTYKSWAAMMNRCYNKKHPAYYLYGGRGIVVCDRWHDFLNYLEDMGERPSRSHTVDRREGDLGYYKENCRWATVKEQNANRRNVRILEFDGRALSVSEWSRLVGIPVSTLYNRLAAGLSVEQVLTEPIGKGNNPWAFRLKRKVPT